MYGYIYLIYVVVGFILFVCLFCCVFGIPFIYFFVVVDLFFLFFKKWIIWLESPYLLRHATFGFVSLHDGFRSRSCVHFTIKENTVPHLHLSMPS